jgi:nitrogen-specific signal transduction histidine kinase
VNELKRQFVSALLVLLTVAAVSCAVINFQQQSLYHLPEDGAIWVDRDAAGEHAVVALEIRPGGPAEQAGIRAGDAILAINGHKIAGEVQVAQALALVGIWQKADYSLRRGGIDFPATVIVGARVLDSAVYYQYVVGLAWLLVGLFVYFRRGNATHATHFFTLCLASFVLATFHYTGKLNNFDQAIYWGNVVAGWFAPAVFLHFCLVFPERPKWLRSRWSRVLLYLPAVLLLTLHVLVSQRMLRVSMSLIEVRWFLDRIWLLYLSVSCLAGAAALSLEYRRAEDPVLRRQLTYMRNGALLGFLPFTLLYVIPYLLGAIPGHYQNMAVLSLILIPVTWAYAVLRYRLMDVDIIFQQGYVYTLATLCVLAVFYGLIFSFVRPETLSAAPIVGLILFATFIFQPIRDWLQEQLDRYVFYKGRYDYRRNLIAFARELTSETDLDAMMAALGDRLVHTLPIQHVAFFVDDDGTDRFALRTIVGARRERLPRPGDPSLDLSFLPAHPDKAYLFFERTHHLLDAVSHTLPRRVRATIADLDLTYYFPCTARGRTIAWLGISRTEKNDFLSSDDVELLTTLSGYVGIAIENARLYHTLQRKAEEYERLKDFSENIVESINVGILAVDLEDRVGSWNTQIERLTGVPRDLAIGLLLRDLFPAELCEEFDEARGDTGIHNIYKFAFRPKSPGPAANGNGNGHGAPRDAILNLAIAPLVSKDLQQIGRLIIFDDITDRDELERRLVQADKLSSIGLLAAGVAHEVNTPLAVISTYAQMLAKQISDNSTQSKLLDKIARQTFRASEIVNSLLNFSRTSTTELTELDLNRLIRETAGLIEHQLSNVAIRAEFDFEEPLPPIKGNAGKLQQVFLNLFLNARDAMERGGALSIRTWSDDASVYAEVRDTGQGISPEHLSRIYDPFFTTKGARKGTGLGLSVSYGIVREHGGEIEVESQPGAGTRFQLGFPLARKPVHA